MGKRGGRERGREREGGGGGRERERGGGEGGRAKGNVAHISTWHVSGIIIIASSKVFSKIARRKARRQMHTLLKPRSLSPDPHERSQKGRESETQSMENRVEKAK